LRPDEHLGRERGEDPDARCELLHGLRAQPVPLSVCPRRGRPDLGGVDDVGCACGGCAGTSELIDDKAELYALLLRNAGPLATASKNGGPAIAILA